MDDAVREYLSRIGRKGAKQGGIARMRLLTAEQKSELGRKAIQARWAKKKTKKTKTTK